MNAFEQALWNPEPFAAPIVSYADAARASGLEGKELEAAIASAVWPQEGHVVEYEIPAVVRVLRGTPAPNIFSTGHRFGCYQVPVRRTWTILGDGRQGWLWERYDIQFKEESDGRRWLIGVEAPGQRVGQRLGRLGTMPPPPFRVEFD